MVLINGRKFACEACIRGHRASSCSHTGRQLQLVRKKGRPNSQCDLCRAKRLNGNFHGRCDCLEENDFIKNERGKIEIFTPFIGQSSSSSPQIDQDITITKGKHSLEALMNPCQCRTTGICLCCSRNSSDKNDETQIKTATIDQPASCGCNGGDKCCDDGIESIRCTPLSVEDSTLQPIKPNCCGKTKNTSTTIPPLPDSDVSSATKMTDEEVDAILAPDCHCGPNCACPGCLMENEESRTKRKEGNEECPDKCITCSACVLGLTRPSGIEAVDAWMEKDKEKENIEQLIGATEDSVMEEEHPLESPGSKDNGSTDVRDREASSSSSSSATTSSDPSYSPINHKKHLLEDPALPPFLSAKKFFGEHFLDPERRKFFTERMKSATKVATVPKRNLTEIGFGEKLNGETDEEWQARYGFQFLTPDAIKIFDHARKFKEEKEKLERIEDLQRQEDEDVKNKRIEELSKLRQRALEARKKKKSLNT